VNDRVFPLIEHDATPVVAQLLNGTIARCDLIDDGLTNTLRRIELTDGRVIGVKQYVLGKSYATESAALREVAGTIPVPEIVCAFDRVIAYRWISGITLDECRRRHPDALARLAAPLGRLLGTLARTRHETSPMDLAPMLAQLQRGLARSRLGDTLADTIHRRLASQRFDEPTCLVHGDFGVRNILVAPSLDRIAGVIDWEAATTGSMLRDVGSLFRYANRYDTAFRTEFERAHGSLPTDWFHRARLLDTTRIAEALAEEPELGVHYNLRNVVAQIAASPFPK